MRRAILAVLLSMSATIAAGLLVPAGDASAQSAPPARLEALPPPPPIPAGSDEPRVRIPVQEGDKVEELREGGRIIMLRVTPPGGTPYYLVDTVGAGVWHRRDSLDDGVRVPMWTIKTFD